MFNNETTTVYDDAKVSVTQNQSLLKSKEFQRSVYLTMYIETDAHHERSEPSEKWNLTVEEENVVDRFIDGEVNPADVNGVRTDALKTLGENGWLHTSVVDRALI